MNKTLAILLCGTLLVSHQVVAESLEQLHFGPKQEHKGRPLDGVAAIVGNDVITQKEYRRIGGNRAVLEQLIMQKLLVQAAKRHNIVIGDTALNIAMEKHKGRGRTPTREQLRNMLMIQKLQQKVVNGLVHISDAEINNSVEKQLKQVDNKMHLVDLLLRVPESGDAATLKEAQKKMQDILAMLQTQSPQSVAAQYDDVLFNDLGWVDIAKIPAIFSKALIDAPSNRYLKPLIDRDGIHLLKILARKSNQKSKGMGIPETRVSHILIKDKNNPNAKTMINRIYQQLQSGADFAELAQKTSQDLGSAANGGSLGWAYPGQMVADFEAVMNKTPVGATSKPFKSPFGYHILRVHQRRQTVNSQRQALEQQAKQRLFQKKAEQEWELWLSRLRDESYVEILK